MLDTCQRMEKVQHSSLRHTKRYAMNVEFE